MASMRVFVLELGLCRQNWDQFFCCDIAMISNRPFSAWLYEVSDYVMLRYPDECHHMT